MNVLERLGDDCGSRGARAGIDASSSEKSADFIHDHGKSQDDESTSFVINKASVRAWMAANGVSNEPPVDERCVFVNS